ncbi:unnamed protein product [Symbiodinium sp. CCMP2592]|nr:unnamed protein product [Symbiodinium sp. CCMP2592]
MSASRRVSATLVHRKPRISLQEVLVDEDVASERFQDSLRDVLREADKTELLQRLGAAEASTLLDLLASCALEEAVVPRLRCRIYYRNFDSNSFAKEGSEALLRSLSGEKDLSLQLLVEDLFQKYLRNVPADFLVSGNDPTKSQRVAGAALLVLPKGAESLAPCGLVSVEKAFLEAFGLDVAKGHRTPLHVFIRDAEFVGPALRKRRVDSLTLALPVQLLRYFRLPFTSTFC